MNLHDSTTNELISFASDRELVEAIMMLGAAYKSRVAHKPPVNEPAFPWARIGNEMFIYASTKHEADELESFVLKNGPEVFALPAGCE